MKTKIEEQRKAKELRSRGFSLNEISKIIGSSKGTVSVWVRNIVISPKGKSRLLTKQQEARTKETLRNKKWVENKHH